MLDTIRGATENVAAEERAAEPERPEAGRRWHAQLRGAGAVDDGEALEIGGPDGEIDTPEVSAVPELELAEARAGGDHPPQRGVGEGDGVEMDHLERGDHRVGGRREVEPPHRQPREELAPNGEVHGERAGPPRAPSRPTPAAAVEPQPHLLHVTRRRVLDEPLQLGGRELPRVEGEREEVHPPPPAPVDACEVLGPQRRHRRRRGSSPRWQPHVERRRVGPPLLPQPPPPRREGPRPDCRLERQEAQNLEPQRVGEVRDAVLLLLPPPPPPLPPPLLIPHHFHPLPATAAAAASTRIGWIRRGRAGGWLVLLLLSLSQYQGRGRDVWRRPSLRRGEAVRVPSPPCYCRSLNTRGSYGFTSVVYYQPSLGAPVYFWLTAPHRTAHSHHPGLFWPGSPARCRALFTRWPSPPSSHFSSSSWFFSPFVFTPFFWVFMKGHSRGICKCVYSV